LICLGFRYPTIPIEYMSALSGIGVFEALSRHVRTMMRRNHHYHGPPPTPDQEYPIILEEIRRQEREEEANASRRCLIM
jgi:hypothetical protein